jgi:hypothetical protein
VDAGTTTGASVAAAGTIGKTRIAKWAWLCRHLVSFLPWAGVYSFHSVRALTHTSPIHLWSSQTAAGADGTNCIALGQHSPAPKQRREIQQELAAMRQPTYPSPTLSLDSGSRAGPSTNDGKKPARVLVVRRLEDAPVAGLRNVPGPACRTDGPPRRFQFRPRPSRIFRSRSPLPKPLLAAETGRATRK